MKNSVTLKFSLAVLLPLTIAWKLGIKPDNPIAIQDAIIKFLDSHNFSVSITDQIFEYMPVIEAVSNSCHLRVARVSPVGYDVDLVPHLGGTTDRTFYVFRGEVYGKQPVRLTVANYLWFRLLRELGIVSSIPPVIAIVSSCDSQNLPWDTLHF
jgi:hypothetical protein